MVGGTDLTHWLWFADPYSRGWYIQENKKKETSESLNVHQSSLDPWYLDLLLHEKFLSSVSHSTGGVLCYSSFNFTLTDMMSDGDWLWKLESAKKKIKWNHLMCISWINKQILGTHFPNWLPWVKEPKLLKGEAAAGCDLLYQFLETRIIRKFAIAFICVF